MLTVPMNRADPFHERDGTGWQFIDIHSGNATSTYSLTDNQMRKIGWSAKHGHPIDFDYQDERIAAQNHY